MTPKIRKVNPIPDRSTAEPSAVEVVELAGRRKWPDNAATELVDDGANGFVATSAEAGDLAAALVHLSQQFRSVCHHTIPKGTAQ